MMEDKNMQQHNQQEVWDAVAEQWKHFRQKPFSELTKILNKLASEGKNPLKSRVLEVGCGNCRNLVGFAKKRFECYGVDFSSGMIKQAHEFSEKNNFFVKLKKMSAIKLDFKKGFFDYVLCIAVLHHLNKEEQKKCLEKIYRIMKPNGKLLLTVWNKDEWGFLKESKSKEIFIPWTVKGKKYRRYYYLFEFKELKELLEDAGFKVLGNKKGKNLIFVCEKKQNNKV